MRHGGDSHSSSLASGRMVYTCVTLAVTASLLFAGANAADSFEMSAPGSGSAADAGNSSSAAAANINKTVKSGTSSDVGAPPNATENDTKLPASGADKLTRHGHQSKEDGPRASPAAVGVGRGPSGRPRDQASGRISPLAQDEGAPPAPPPADGEAGFPAAPIGDAANETDPAPPGTGTGTGGGGAGPVPVPKPKPAPKPAVPKPANAAGAKDTGFPPDFSNFGNENWTLDYGNPNQWRAGEKSDSNVTLQEQIYILSGVFGFVGLIQFIISISLAVSLSSVSAKLRQLTDSMKPGFGTLNRGYLRSEMEMGEFGGGLDELSTRYDQHAPLGNLPSAGMQGMDYNGYGSPTSGPKSGMPGSRPAGFPRPHWMGERAAARNYS